MWGYRFGYTAAQIELALADAPIINYKRDKGKKGKKDFKKPDSLKLYEAQLKLNERNAERKEGKIHFDFGGLKKT